MRFDRAVSGLLPPHAGTSVPRTGASLLAEYASMVEAICEGYGDNIYEYANDLSVRSFIERVLTEHSLATMAGFDAFAVKAAELDEALKRCLTEESWTSAPEWWYQRLPLRAGAELVADMRDRYGYVAVEIS